VAAVCVSMAFLEVEATPPPQQVGVDTITLRLTIV
jgi:hypothetical protein